MEVSMLSLEPIWGTTQGEGSRLCECAGATLEHRVVGRENIGFGNGHRHTFIIPAFIS